MNIISTILGIPLGWIMYALYTLTHNYLIALFILTLLTRLAMVPSALKQQKNTVKMNMLKPEIDEIRKKYAGNNNKINEETMKLYNREGFNPMAGCLPLLITFPILFGLIDVISKPLTHMLRINKDLIDLGVEIVNNNPDLFETTGRNAYYIQLQVIRGVKEMPELFSTMGQDAIAAIQNLNFNYFGLNMTETPAIWPLSAVGIIVVIPLLAGITSLLVSLVTMRNTAGGDPNANASMRGMMLIMPLFSLWFSSQVPAGVGMYWILSNVLAMAQTMIMHKIYNPKEMAEQARVEAEKRREEERKARIEAKKNDPNKGLSQKEINRRKLAEARERHAEKYGDQFADVTDEDLA